MRLAVVLGAMSKALATIATQPLIVAKVGLQSKPPPARNGKPFKSFIEVMNFIIEHEGLRGLFKGIGPQILKGFLVQGILMMTKERYVHCSVCSPGDQWLMLFRVELMFVLLLRYLKNVHLERLQSLTKQMPVPAAASEMAKPLQTS